MRSLPLAILPVALALAACNGDPSCDDAAGLQARLDGASAGETVSVGACTIRGSIRVPAGVRLEGAGRGSTVIVAGGGDRGVTLDPGEGPTTLADLTVESGECAGVVAMGEGRVRVEGVDVAASEGVGIAAEGTTELTLDDVAIAGPVTAETAGSTTPPLPPFRCGDGSIATHGLVVVDAASADLTDVSAAGFGAFGALLVRSAVRWTGGGADTNLGAGVEVWDGSATLEGLVLGGSRDGAGAVESFGGVFGGGADVTTRGLTVEGGDAFGLFHDSATAVHEDLTARDNGFAAVWAQTTASLEVTGASAIEDNGFAGVAALSSTGLVVRGAAIARTVERVGLMGPRTVRAADGLHLVDSDATLDDIELRDNGRVGVLLDLAGASTSRVGLSAVTVDGAGSALGAIAQNGTVEAGWDDGVTRDGATATNDDAFTGTLDIAGAVGPPCFPPLDDLDTVGIARLVGP